jgi:hypothetical protein
MAAENNHICGRSTVLIHSDNEVEPLTSWDGIERANDALALLPGYLIATSANRLLWAKRNLPETSSCSRITATPKFAQPAPSGVNSLSEVMRTAPTVE